mmetsp:Transcript_5221/g.8759  ORF Transcript_5221/g.8759 Transcript_5221/m.8759 type:complete len:145 (-) Transcript_5221:346-780(-)
MANLEDNKDKEELVTHYGSCHCGLIQWEAIASPHLTVWDCNCSICRMKGNVHFIIPASRFKLLSDPSLLSTYTFNTHQAKHKFCKKCGVQSFYHPRSNPDGIGLQIYSVKPGTIKSIETKTFDGQRWEQTYQNIGNVISKHSKL